MPYIEFIGGLLLLVGFIGCFVPIIPGPMIAYVAILLRHFAQNISPYTNTQVVALGVVMAVIFVLDFVVPGWVTRKLGGSKAAMRGSLIGMLVGIFLTPIGMLLGMFLGALIGELMHDNRRLGRAFGVACITFVGFLLTTGMKVIYCGVVAWYFFFW
ncbi:MAG: DUF456 domain-containing protein [Prevotellaceae bacterium]|jgi:uncharacterized protein YqgC (DUF456 family)|nr:DUF456 domain-containing protein [Prevotellaceae bacterium]